MLSLYAASGLKDSLATKNRRLSSRSFETLLDYSIALKLYGLLFQFILTPCISHLCFFELVDRTHFTLLPCPFIVSNFGPFYEVAFKYGLHCFGIIFSCIYLPQWHESMTRLLAAVVKYPQLRDSTFNSHVFVDFRTKMA